MSYSYLKERPNLFTEDGQVRFLKVRDKVQAAIRSHGAFRAQELGFCSWEEAACLDRMIELGELVALRPPESCWGQFQVYANAASKVQEFDRAVSQLSGATPESPVGNNGTAEGRTRNRRVEVTLLD